MKNDERRKSGRDLADILQIIRLEKIDIEGWITTTLSNAMPMKPPAPFSTPHSEMTDDPLFELPEVLPNEGDTGWPAPTWEQQMAHAQMLIGWQKDNSAETSCDQKLPPDFEPFVM